MLPGLAVAESVLRLSFPRSCEMSEDVPVWRLPSNSQARNEARVQPAASRKHHSSSPGSASDAHVQGLIWCWLHDEQPKDPGAYGSLTIGGSLVLKGASRTPTAGISRPHSPTAADVNVPAGSYMLRRAQMSVWHSSSCCSSIDPSQRRVGTDHGSQRE